MHWEEQFTITFQDISIISAVFCFFVLEMWIWKIALHGFHVYSPSTHWQWKIWGSHGSNAEHSGLLGSDVLFGEQLPAFWGLRVPAFILNCLTLKNNTLCFLTNPGTTCPTTQRHIPWDLNPQWSGSCVLCIETNLTAVEKTAGLKMLSKMHILRILLLPCCLTTDFHLLGMFPILLCPKS